MRSRVAAPFRMALSRLLAELLVWFFSSSAYTTIIGIHP
jgi:hypothetical protein